MSDALRSKIIRLAHQNPELRPHLMPLLGIGKRASKLEIRLSREILGAIIRAVTPALAKYNNIPVVEKFLDGVISIEELVRDIHRESLLLNSPERYLDIYDDGVITKSEMEIGLEAFKHLPSVRQFLDGKITSEELRGRMKARIR